MSDTKLKITKYANRKLYNTETSTYINLTDLAGYSVETVLVWDRKKNADVTRKTLAYANFVKEFGNE